MEDSKKNFPNFHDAYLRQYIQQADTKASWLFAANSAILIWLVGSKEFVAALKSGSNAYISLALVFSCLGLVASCAFLFDAIRARSLFYDHSGIVYFDHVAKFGSYSEFINQVEKQSDEEIFRERLKSQYAMSVICSRKYSRLTAASMLSVVSVSLIAIVRTIFSLTT